MDGRCVGTALQVLVVVFGFRFLRPVGVDGLEKVRCLEQGQTTVCRRICASNPRLLLNF